MITREKRIDEAKPGSNAMTSMQWKPNVTVAAVIEKDGRFLMVEEKSQGQEVINQPAGHLEKGETLVEAVKREVLEETGWCFTPQAVTGVYLYTSPGNDVTYLRICFCGGCYGYQADRPLDDGIIRALWFSKDELRAQRQRLRSPMVTQCVDDYLNGNTFPLEYLKHQLDAHGTWK